MRDVVLVTAYTPDDKRLNLLINCINFLSDQGKDIILVTHSTNTPEFLVKKCKYFLYSSENKLIDLPETKMFLNRYCSDLFFGSKLINRYRHTTLAIYNMIYLGISIAKNLNYDIVHYVEYDSDIQNLDLFEYSNKLIENGYEVVYSILDDGEMFGGYFAIRTKSYEFDELIYNEEKLTQEMKKHFVTERLTRDFFFANKKTHTIEYKMLPELGFNYTKFKHFEKDGTYCFPVIYEDYFQIVHDNQNEHDENLLVIVNDNKVFTNLTKPKTFKIFPVGEIENTKKITIIVNEVLIGTYETDSQEKINFINDNSFVNTY